MKLSSKFGALVSLGFASATQMAFAAQPSDGEIVTFSGASNSITYTAALYRPDNWSTRTNWPAIVMMHGCGGMWSNNSFSATNSDGTPNLQANVESWGRYLADQGYYVVAVDSFQAHGYTQKQCAETRRDEPSPPGPHVFHPDTFPYEQRVIDARNAHSFLTGTGRVASTNVGLLGWSQGAQAAMVEAAETTRDETDETTSRTNHLFKATAVFYPGCGADMDFATTTPTVRNSFWRPHRDFMMYIGQSDGFYADCNTRMSRAIDNYNSGPLSGHEAIWRPFSGIGHSFDHQERVIAAKPDTWFPSADDKIQCDLLNAVNGRYSNYCKMVVADRQIFGFFESRL